MDHNIKARIEAEEKLSREEAAQLLETAVGSRDYYELLYFANQYSRQAFEEKGLIFAQIGLDLQPCGINCKFCSMAKDSMCGKDDFVRSLEEVVEEAKALVDTDIQDLFLMTTAQFSQELFLEYGKAVRAVLPADMRLVANIADFDAAYAQKLKEAGFTGVYHICRLREGIDTGAKLEDRIRTMDAVKIAGLELYYCVEPIGPEHTNEELAEEMVRIRDYPVGVMAVMKRTAVPGTPLAEKGEISAARLALICAVATLTARPPRAMCVHEPDELCLMAGANQLYAELGSNPRDTEKDTRNGRGFSVEDARKMLEKTQWGVKTR